MAIDPQTPVIVGVGQITRHWDAKLADAQEVSSDPPSPRTLTAESARRALTDSGVAELIAPIIDRVVVVRTMLDSVNGAPQPFGRCANPPATLAADIGLSPCETIYSVVGGDQPQALVNEAAEAIFSGQARAVLLAGAEATATMKAALRAGIDLDWSGSVDGPLNDRGLGSTLLSRYDLANGLGAPTQTYPAFEHALANRWGHDRRTHRAAMSTLWAGFSRVAAKNPYAQFPLARDEAFLSTESRENYPVADPYLKWDVAQDAVNQGAAVLLTSVSEAERLGIPPARRIHLHGYSHLKDRVPSERPDLSRSVAMERAIGIALRSAGLAASDIAYFDLYSCFPVAVLLAAEALGLDWRSANGAEALTVTGGLPFFGGAGNNYSMHAIASMVDRLRVDPGSFGLILANGGFLSKEAVGVYSSEPRTDWKSVSSAEEQAVIDGAPAPTLIDGDSRGEVESFTVTYAKGEAQRGFAFLRTAEGGRILARTEKGEAGLLAAAMRDGISGQQLVTRHHDGANYLVFG
jgi:acetyl-CoA C-acetyltransferase